jgi:hypothetical protein
MKQWSLVVGQRRKTFWNRYIYIYIYIYICVCVCVCVCVCISSNTSTFFGRIYSPSLGGTPCGHNNWYLLLFLDDCLLSWRTTDSRLKRTVSTSCCIHTVYLLMMGYKYARNI